MDANYTILEFHKILALLGDLAHSDMAREKLSMLTPTSDLADARTEMEKTDDAFTLSVRFGSPPFSSFRDMRALVRRASSGAKLTLRDLLDIARVLRQTDDLAAWYDRCAGVSSSLDDLFCALESVSFLREKIENAILSEEEISDSASPALAQIRRKIARASQKLRDTLDSMMQRKDIQECLQDSRITMRDGRYVLPIQAAHRGKIPGLVHAASASGQTIFIEPLAVVDAGNDIRLLEEQEAEEIERIIEELCGEVGQWADAIIRDHEVCAEIEVYFTKARLAEKMHAFTPDLSDDGVIDLKNARHPLIPYEKAVPITFTLGDKYNALLITGPNTGGKTVALKTCGLLTLMAMSGLMIPADAGSHVSVFDQVLADIGDTQSIEENLSTFSAHMRRVGQILETANASSLILLDELGSGTDPVEGAALAQTIIERLYLRGARLMVTTHYQELKLYAAEREGVENAACVFDTDTMMPTYQLRIGAPGKSNAFAICQNLGLPTDMIEDAKTLVSDENRRFEEAVERLDDARQSIEREREEFSRDLEQARQERAQAQKELEDIRAAKNQRLEEASREALRIVETTKQQANEMLTDLEKLRKEKEKADFAAHVSDAKGYANRTMRQMYQTASPVIEGAPIEGSIPQEVRAGMEVTIASSGQKGTVVGKPDRAGNVFVQVGAMRTRAAITDLRLADTKNTTEKKAKDKSAQKGHSTSFTPSNEARRGSMELDIRGCTCSEGVYEMEAFLDNAMMAHIDTVTIIHGKGTGQLRKAIHQKLRTLKFVKSYRLGTFGEGEDGVTIVTLK